MNKKAVLLRNIIEKPNITQRELSTLSGLSLGAVNSLLKECSKEGLLEENKGKERRLTKEGLSFMEPFKVDRALIMAAGFGSRFVPLTYEMPKGMIEVFGERMVDRQIEQLIAAGVTDITVVVGYMKEKFEYLRDKYGAKLLYNPEYAEKNNLSTIWHARDLLYGKNCYILSSDNWIRENIYHKYEGVAWYSAVYAEGDTKEWVIETDKKGRMTGIMEGGRDSLYMYGPAYFSREFSEKFLPVLERYYEIPGTEQYYWETVLMDMLGGLAKKRLTAYFGRIKEAEGCSDIEMYVNPQPADMVYEFENLEELRAFDGKYNEDSGSEAMRLVSGVFGVPESKIQRIRCLKAGMTNRSWLFSVEGKQYICRIPGEGTQKLIKRREEAAVYEAIRDTGLTERLVYLDPETGYKISRYYEGSRNADARNEADLKACMSKLRELHESGIELPHSFDIEERIDFYVKLCEEAGAKDPSGAIPFVDFKEVYANEKKLCGLLQRSGRKKTIAHIDSVPDNFLFLEGADISETERDISRVKLIDWEYCGMCDPLVDPAMFIIYSYMNEEEAERLIRMYFGREATDEELGVIYSYISLGGFLWALWAVYKERLGVTFGDYTLKMYAYAKDYFKKAEKLWKKVSIET